MWLHQCNYEAQRYTWKAPITVLYESWKTRISRCSGWLDVRRAVLPSLPFAAFTRPAIFLPACACVHMHTPIYALTNTFIHLHTFMHLYTLSFCTRNHQKWPLLLVKKMELWTPDLKNGNHFLSTLPKFVGFYTCLMSISLLGEFGQILKIDDFRLIFDFFFLIKSQNKSPMPYKRWNEIWYFLIL